MGLIEFAINKIKKIGINKEVLELGFLKEPNELGIRTSIEEQLETLVIKGLVLKDLDVLGGIQVTIPVESCKVTRYKNTFYNINAVINVPFELTNGRQIIEVLNMLVIYSQEFTYGGNNRIMQNLDMLNRKVNMENNMRPITNLKLIAPNTILIFDNVNVLTNSVLNVMVENNENLSNISMRHSDAFYKLVKLATEAYIYNKVIVDLNKGVLFNGHEAGVINEILNSYSGKEEEYEEFLNSKWGKIAFMSDQKSMNDLVTGMIGLV